MTRPRKLTLAAFLVALFAMIAFGVIRHFHWDQRVYYSLTTDGKTEQAVGLSRYIVVIDALRVEGVDNNLSGITFDPERQQLWAVVNGPSLLLGLSLDGKLLSRHPLTGFHDVEGVAYLGDNRLALVEERHQTIVVMPIPAASGELQREDFIDLRVDLHEQQNKEYEGLAYDSESDRLMIAKERDPLRLYEIGEFTGIARQRLSLDVVNVTDTLGSGVFLDDIAGLAFDTATSHLLALSDESRMVVELDAEGKAFSFLLLEEGSAQLKAGIPQAEGVTLDDQGRLYIVSEPNLFYRFEQPTSDPN